MNFKKYHVSRNLWNAIKYGYTSLSENNVWVYSTSLTGSVYRIPCKPNTTYTLYLAENVDITIWRIREVSTDVVPNASSTSVPTTGTYASSVPASKSATFTTSASAQYILFQTNESAYDSVLPVIMLIEGNTKIPYEPYSSEVWHDTPHYIHNTSTDTITTLPADIYANDTTATVGLKGNMNQSSTPTPDNPIMPQGTGERTGNLVKYWKAAYVTASGGVNPNRVNGMSFPVKIEAGQTVSFTNPKPDFGRGIAVFSGFDGVTLTDMIYRSTNNTVTYTANSDCYVIIWGNYDNVTSMDENVFALCGQMLNLGDTPLPYEPYGYKIPISSASTTTPVYLGEVETTRKIRKLVLTGEETKWYYYENATGTVKFFYLVIVRVVGVNLNNLLNTHGFNMSEVTQQSGNVLIRVYAVSEGMETVEELKSYLAAQYAAGTPVTVWYVLATEETGIVNEPLMKIGNYADGISDVTIPTTIGKNTFDVEATLKPSEVSISYTGWHDTDVKEYISDTNIADWESVSISQMEDNTIQELQGGNWV